MKEIRRSWREALGLGLLLAWMYCSFFSCGLIPHASVLRSSEHVWIYAGLGMAITALCLVALRARTPFAGKTTAGAIGAAAAGVGSLLIWLSFLHESWNVPVSAAGGLLAGSGLAVMAVIWCQRLSGFKVSKLEAAVPMAFMLAFATYFVLLAIKGPYSPSPAYSCPSAAWRSRFDAPISGRALSLGNVHAARTSPSRDA